MDWVRYVREFHVAIPGDIMVDWLAEGGQTIDMRTLWASRVGLGLAESSGYQVGNSD